MVLISIYLFYRTILKITYSQDAVVCQYHLNALYDCINHVFWESRIDLPTKKSEIGALIDFINHRNYPENSLLQLTEAMKAIIL